MRVANIEVFDSANGNTGNWVQTSSHWGAWSLHVIGLEAGGSLSVNMSNAASQPAPGDPTGVSVATVTNAGNSFASGSTVAQWIQIVKTPGTTPTPTTVRLFGPVA